MVKVTSLPDDVEFDVNVDETLLAAGLRSGLAFAHACGGRAKCSTCRISVVDGLDACPPRTEAEASMAARLGFSEEVRLACQLQPRDTISVRRLVLDETDIMMCSQLDRAVATRTGEAKKVVILFSAITNFTSISERLSPYDVMYLLNRYFVQVGDIVERNGGFIDKFIGDGMMAIFGIGDDSKAPLRAVSSSLQMLDAVDQMKPYFQSMYDADLDIRIGLHYGEAVIGSLGSIGHERLTAIGDVVNVASRIESANKEAGTRLLISQALHDEVEASVEVTDFIRIRPRGSNERISLYEIHALKPEAEALLNAGKMHETMLFAGKKWFRLFEEDDLALNEWRIVPMDDYDMIVVRGSDGFYAFNNACPHLHFPLFEYRALAESSIHGGSGSTAPVDPCSTFTKDRGVVCRWHESCFDLQTGEIRDWAPTLQDDGTSSGAKHLGNISKNRTKLTVYACRIHDGYLWASFE